MFDCLKAVQNRKLERFNSPNIVTPSTQQHHRGEVNLPKSKNACTSSPLLLPYNFDLFINRVQPIGILASPFHNQRHRSLTTKQRLIYAVIKEPPSTLVFLHCIYIYTRYTAKYFLANTTVVGSFFSLTIPLHFPFQFPPTELCSLCFAYVLAPLLLYAYSPILFLSLSVFLSTVALQARETKRPFAFIRANTRREIGDTCPF